MAFGECPLLKANWLSSANLMSSANSFAHFSQFDETANDETWNGKREKVDPSTELRTGGGRETVKRRMGEKRKLKSEFLISKNETNPNSTIQNSQT